MTSLLQSTEGGHHVVNELPFEPAVFGVAAFVGFLLLLALLWSFRNTLALDPHDSGSGTDAGGANPDSGRGSRH